MEQVVDFCVMCFFTLIVNGEENRKRLNIEEMSKVYFFLIVKGLLNQNVISLGEKL